MGRGTRLPTAVEMPLSALLGVLNRLPTAARERAYAASGWTEALPLRRVGAVRSEALAAWVTAHYPRRRYPVIFIGSANGALVHLAAVHEAGRALLTANPDLVLHHMHDPNQDRLMIAGMTYFRVKWHRVPTAYRRCVRDHLAPGGMVIAVDCTLRWPTTRVADRYVFQFGALGDATPEEYQLGGPRVADLLARYGSAVRSWARPPPTPRARRRSGACSRRSSTTSPPSPDDTGSAWVCWRARTTGGVWPPPPAKSVC
ncbi:MULTISPECIES: hypothetical protein [unclassified Streptomyces]|uniref:hypothetical protein n=1 Tax=unclassified Streptomyces TaxID=2593676 RepID=UPI00336AA480